MKSTTASNTSPKRTKPGDSPLLHSGRHGAILGAVSTDPSLPLGLEYHSWQTAGAWGVRLQWAGHRRRTLDLYGLAAPEEYLESEIARRLLTPVPVTDRTYRLAQLTVGRGQKDLKKDETRRQRFLAANPGKDTRISFEDPILTVLRPEPWAPSAVRAANTAFAQLGAGFSLAESRDAVWCRVAGTSVSTPWVGQLQSFIVPRVDARARRVV